MTNKEAYASVNLKNREACTDLPVSYSDIIMEVCSHFQDFVLLSAGCMTLLALYVCMCIFKLATMQVYV